MKPKISSSLFVITIISTVFLIFLDCVSVNVNGAIYPESSSLSLTNFYPFERECTWMVKENPDDCLTYFQCRHGHSILRRCPRQLAWNSEFGICDWEAKAKCKAKNKYNGNGAPLGKDETRKKGERPKYPKTCQQGTNSPGPTCGQFYLCGASGPVLQNCPAGLYFQPSLGICDWPWNVQCSTSTTSTGTGVSGSQVGSGSGPSIPESPSTTTTPTTGRPTTPTTTTASTLPPFFTSSTTTTTWVTTTTTRPTATSTTTATNRPTTGSAAPTTYPILIPNSDFICVCYFESWSAYRTNGGKFDPSLIDPSKCTHLIYAFAIFSPTTFEIQMQDPWIDGPDGLDFYGQITSFAKYGITPMIALGGWNDSGDLKWDELLSDPEKIKKLCESIRAFLLKYNFKGIDIDFEYPGCPNGNCAWNFVHQREKFIIFIKYLKQFLKNDFLITIAISCNEEIVKVAYDLRTLQNYITWFNVMTYDYHGSWEKQTGHVAPLLPASEKDPNAHLTVQHSIEMLLGFGVEREKMCLGMPLYGTTFTLANARNHGLNAPATGPGEAGNMTKTKGMLSYGEICQYDFKIVEKNPQNKWGPYMAKDEFWVSADDKDMFTKKCDFIMEYGLKGAMVWSIDLDDFQGICTNGKERYTCLGTINKRLRGPKGTLYTHKWRKIREEEKKRKEEQQKRRKNRSRSRRRRF